MVWQEPKPLGGQAEERAGQTFLFIGYPDSFMLTEAQTLFIEAQSLDAAVCGIDNPQQLPDSALHQVWYQSCLFKSPFGHGMDNCSI